MTEDKCIKKILEKVDEKGYKYYNNSKYQNPEEILKRKPLNLSDMDRVDETMGIKFDKEKGTVTIKKEVKQ